MASADASSFVWGDADVPHVDPAQDEGNGDVPGHPEVDAVPLPPFGYERSATSERRRATSERGPSRVDADPWDHGDPWQSGSGQHAWWGHSWGMNDGWSGRSWGNEAQTYGARHDSNTWGRRWSQGETWTTGSTGADSSGDAGPRERDHGVPDGGDPARPGGHDSPDGAAGPWTTMTVKEPRRPTTTGNANVMERGRGPSEKMVVPTFSGSVEAGGDDLGASARSYLRQVAAWRKMTRLSADQHGLVLYQNLSGKAWIDAERLDVDLLGMDTGAEYFINWIKERYLDVQITQIGRGLSDFFRRLRRKDGQTIREYLSDFDRALARLTECGCVLPDMASAWVFVDRMSLEESAELNLLASVGNEYNLKRLQQAAIVQDRSLRKPWESSTRSASRDSAAPGRGPRREWWNKKTNTAHLTGHGDNEDDDYPEADPGAENAVGDVVPEAVAEEWYETFMTHETAKQKYRDSLRQRGTDSEALREIANDRLAQAKAKSFCAGCKRRGHWHKDSCCPLNQGARKQGEQGGGNTTTSSSQSATTPARTSYQCSVVYVTWDIDKPVASTQLLAIADTACSKSVMGAGWLDSYLKETAKIDYKPQFLNVNENFKFGASRVFEASYAVIVTFALKGVVVQQRLQWYMAMFPCCSPVERSLSWARCWTSQPTLRTSSSSM